MLKYGRIQMMRLAIMSFIAALSCTPIAISSAYASPKTTSAKTLPAASTYPVPTPIKSMSSALIDLIRNKLALEDYFDTTFLNAVPPAEMKSLLANIAKQYGRPIRTLDIVQKTSQSAIVTIEFEKAVGTVNINITATTPYKVNGLLFESFSVKDDSAAKIDAEFAALPGKAGYVVERLNDAGGRQMIAGRNYDNQFAIASTFKLYILAELASQIDARERRWSDVVPLSHRSFSSKATDKWPKDSPVTLETLALQMISVSDNSATDTLLHTLGRANVERKLALIGHGAPDKTLPFLSTVEAFALKSPGNAELRDRYLKSTEAQQRLIVEQEKGRLGFDNVDDRTFAKGPAYIDSLEWFASPYDISKLLDHMRRSRNEKILQIMAINPGIGQEAANWNYVGYKGGSEPGVMSMSLLLQSNSGHWYTVSGSWNNSDKKVDNEVFSHLIKRLVQMVRNKQN